jgi:hypothetical protein
MNPSPRQLRTAAGVGTGVGWGGGRGEGGSFPLEISNKNLTSHCQPTQTEQLPAFPLTVLKF